MKTTTCDACTDKVVLLNRQTDTINSLKWQLNDATRAYLRVQAEMERLLQEKRDLRALLNRRES